MEDFDNNIDFNKYRVFLAVAEFKSFSKAAEYLYLSQPAVSHAIKELEQQLNTKLFIRNNKSVILTEDGEKIKFYIRNAFDNISFGEKLLREKNDDLTGTIRIGIYSHISLFMLPKVMKKFNFKYPNAKFYIYSSSNAEMLEKLRNNELDLVVMQYPIFINDNTFKEEILCKLETCFFADNNYYNLYSNNRDLIKEFPLILPMRGFPDISRLEEILKEHNLVLRHTYTSYTNELTKELVKSGIGIGWGLRKSIETDIEQGLLYPLSVGFKMPETIFSIAYNENLLDKTTKEFVRFFKEEINNL